jgi:hypothetical protein
MTLPEVTRMSDNEREVWWSCLPISCGCVLAVLMVPVLAVVAFVIGLQVCVPMTDTSEEKKEDALKHPLSLGQVATVRNLEVSVESYELAGTYESPMYAPPWSRSTSPGVGKVFLWVLIRAKNVSWEENDDGLRINLMYEGKEYWGGASPLSTRRDPKHPRLFDARPPVCLLEPEEATSGWEGFEVPSDIDLAESVVIIKVEDCHGEWFSAADYRAWRLLPP